MIESRLKPQCALCPGLDAQVETVNIYAENEAVERVIIIECSNKKICDQIEKYLKAGKEPNL